jgi:hypothetical protein
MKICTTTEIVRVVTEIEVFVMFVKPDGEGTARKRFGMA